MLLRHAFCLECIDKPFICLGKFIFFKKLTFYYVNYILKNIYVLDIPPNVPWIISIFLSFQMIFKNATNCVIIKIQHVFNGSNYAVIHKCIKECPAKCTLIPPKMYHFWHVPYITIKLRPWNKMDVKVVLSVLTLLIKTIQYHRNKLYVI